MKIKLVEGTTVAHRIDIPDDAIILSVDHYIERVAVNHSPGVEFIDSGEYFVKYIIKDD
jgi:hypothetical protein